MAAGKYGEVDPETRKALGLGDRRCRGLLPELLFDLNVDHLRVTVIKTVQMRSGRL